MEKEHITIFLKIIFRSIHKLDIYNILFFAKVEKNKERNLLKSLTKTNLQKDKTLKRYYNLFVI